MPPLILGFRGQVDRVSDRIRVDAAEMKKRRQDACLLKHLGSVEKRLDQGRALPAKNASQKSPHVFVGKLLNELRDGFLETPVAELPLFVRLRVTLWT